MLAYSVLLSGICKPVPPIQPATRYVQNHRSMVTKASIPEVSTRRLVTDTSKLFIAISELDEKFNIKLKSFPSVVVVGPQSAGKSSVIEAICGETILPKAMKMATMKPMHLTTIRSPDKKFKVGDRELRTEKDAAEEIDRVNNNGHVQKVNVTIWSPDVYNASLIDLPGLFVVAGKNEADLPKKVKDMSCQHLQDPNTIPLIVHAAPSDPATNHAIKLVGKFGRETDTLGIITKVDMLERQKTGFIEDMLHGETYAMGHGYCAVILRNDKDIEAGMTVNDKMKIERDFFTRMNLRPSGVDQMRKMISNIQFARVKEQIPNLISDIDSQVSNLKISQSFLNNLLNNDQKKLASRLRMMIEKLVGSSIDRAEFEDKLKKEFKDIIGKYMEETFEKHPRNVIPKFSTKHIDGNVFSYNINHKSNPSNYKEDGIKELFSYGLVSPVFLDNQTITDTFTKEIELGLSVPMIDLYINDPLGKKRAQWNRYLNGYFTRLLADDNIHKIVHDVTEKLLLEYIYNDVEGSDDLTKKFAEYMIKEIGNEAYESKIKYSITAMLNIERRPQVSVFEVVRYVTQMHPNYFTFRGQLFESLSRENKKLKLEVYSDEWNEAYLRVVSDKLTENCYRNVAVNLLDRMVEKLLEMCIDMFNKENAVKEQNKVKDKTDKLIEIRNIIASYAATKNGNGASDDSTHAYPV